MRTKIEKVVFFWKWLFYGLLGAKSAQHYYYVLKMCSCMCANFHTSIGGLVQNTLKNESLRLLHWMTHASGLCHAHNHGRKWWWFLQSQIEWSWLHGGQVLSGLLSHFQCGSRLATGNHVPSNIQLKGEDTGTSRFFPPQSQNLGAPKPYIIIEACIFPTTAIQ